MHHGHSNPLAVLIVEDDPIVRELLKAATEFVGHLAFTAVDTRQATAMLGRRSFDRIIVDLLLPGEDGLTWTELLAGARPDLVRSTTLVSAGELSPEQTERLGRLGVRFLGKPFTLDEFHEAVDLPDLRAPKG